MNDTKRMYEAMKEVQRLCFAVDEARLYLDTHPDCPKGLKFFNMANKKAVEAMASYQRLYGPITTTHLDTEADGWTWISAPWPWEMGV